MNIVQEIIIIILDNVIKIINLMELAEEYAMNNHGFMKDNFKMARQMDMAERLEH